MRYPLATSCANPLDVVYDGALHVIGHTEPHVDQAAMTTLRTYPPLAAYTDDMLREALEIWAGLAVFTFCRESDSFGLRPGTSIPMSPPGPQWANHPTPPPPAPGRNLALLSLFDGVGTARLGVDDILAACGSTTPLSHSWFVERDAALSHAVQRWWARRGPSSGAVPHRQLGADVWDLLHPGHAGVQEVCGTLPLGSLLLVVAGSPCQQLTTMGRGGGELGLCGGDSCHFLAIPLLCHLLQCLRPDLLIHLVVENAGSMLARHREAI